MKFYLGLCQNTSDTHDAISQKKDPAYVKKIFRVFCQVIASTRLQNSNVVPTLSILLRQFEDQKP